MGSADMVGKFVVAYGPKTGPYIGRVVGLDGAKYLDVKILALADTNYSGSGRESVRAGVELLDSYEDAMANVPAGIVLRKLNLAGV